MEKESGDRVRAERIAREEGDEIDGIDRFTDQSMWSCGDHEAEQTKKKQRK